MEKKAYKPVTNAFTFKTFLVIAVIAFLLWLNMDTILNVIVMWCKTGEWTI